MRVGILVVAAMLLSACSTVYVHVDEPARIYPYKGSQTAVQGVVRSWHEPAIPGEAPVRALLDVPLCVATDTLLLPMDWLIWWSNSP